MKNIILTLVFSIATAINSFADTPYGRMSDFQDGVDLNPWRDILIVIGIVIIISIIQVRKENKSNTK